MSFTHVSTRGFTSQALRTSLRAVCVAALRCVPGRWHHPRVLQPMLSSSFRPRPWCGPALSSPSGSRACLLGGWLVNSLEIYLQHPARCLHSLRERGPEACPAARLTVGGAALPPEGVLSVWPAQRELRPPPSFSSKAAWRLHAAGRRRGAGLALRRAWPAASFSFWALFLKTCYCLRYYK